MKKLVLALAASALFALPAFAGEQYVDKTGFAVSGYDVVAYRALKQAPVGEKQPAAIPGRADITAEYNGAKFAFATEENRDLFLKDPAHYVPQYDGHCAYGVAQGGKVPGNPNLWRIVDDKLYLNILPRVVGWWEDDIPGNLKQSESNWQKVEPDAASKDNVPKFDPQAPLKSS